MRSHLWYIFKKSKDAACRVCEGEFDPLHILLFEATQNINIFNQSRFKKTEHYIFLQLTYPKWRQNQNSMHFVTKSLITKDRDILLCFEQKWRINIRYSELTLIYCCLHYKMYS